MEPKELRTPEELAAFAAEHNLRPDWHEPDEQEITVIVHGDEFDNAMGTRPFPNLSTGGFRREVTVALIKDGFCVAVVNLANLFAWAASAGRADS